jgi:hypothetical protein
VPSTFFLEYHDHERRIGAGTRVDDTCGYQFMNNFISFIFGGKWMMTRANIGRKIVDNERNGMITNTTRRRKSLGGRKNNSVFGDDTLEVKITKGISIA